MKIKVRSIFDLVTTLKKTIRLRPHPRIEKTTLSSPSTQIPSTPQNIFAEK
jgi:hypothetical protein